MRTVLPDLARLTALEAGNRSATVYIARMGALTRSKLEEILALLLLGLLAWARRLHRAGTTRAENFILVFEAAPIGMAITSLADDRLGQIAQANHELARITGYTRAELLEMNIVALAHPAERTLARANLELVRNGSRPEGTVERSWKHADGSSLSIAASWSVMREPDGREFCITQVLDVTVHRQAEERLTRQAFYDPLTELPNRTLMRDHLVQALVRARRSDTGAAVLYVDLDNFKDINDLHGHAVGDAVLVEAAQRLRSCLRASDTASRISGDKFVVVCEDVTGESRNDIDGLAQRITAALGTPLELAGSRMRLEASTGVALGRGAADPDELIRQADAAMYDAKRQGKARHALADVAMVERAHRNLVVDQELRRALERDEFRLHYQPVVDLRSGRVVSVEALLRWQHPERGLLLPGEFLDVAEERSLIVPIGRWVLRTACAQAATWCARWGDMAPSVAINVAGRQLANHDFADHVREALVASGVPPRQLIIEVTERQMLAVADFAQADLAHLSDTDVQLSIDDFGTGYSTFEYLRRFHFDILKIDRTFVSGLGSNQTDTAIVRALLALSDSLKLTVIAEGVESERQLDELGDLGCRFVQGFHLSRPTSGAGIDGLLRAADAPPTR